jgi:hypothetical protein
MKSDSICFELLGEILHSFAFRRPQKMLLLQLKVAEPRDEPQNRQHRVQIFARVSSHFGVHKPLNAHRQIMFKLAAAPVVVAVAERRRKRDHQTGPRGGVPLHPFDHHLQNIPTGCHADREVL